MDDNMDRCSKEYIEGIHYFLKNIEGHKKKVLYVVHEETVRTRENTLHEH
jgi:hypothetical protein